MKLNEEKTVIFTGYEIATILGCLRYIKDCKSNALGKHIKYVNSAINKLNEYKEEKK